MAGQFSIKQFELSDKRYSLKVSFKTKANLLAVRRLILCSRLLHSLAPNLEGVWREVKNPRVNACILGFTKNIDWTTSIGNSTIEGTSNKKFSDKDIEKSIEGILGKKDSEFTNTEYKIFIKDLDKDKLYEYRFDSRSRAVVAFCILWDGKDHPRNEMEVTLDSKLDSFLFGKENGKRGYGDPSKTVDELRNQGFPRQTDLSPRGISIQVSRNTSYGTLQEHYKLLKKEQSLEDKVGRSVIKSSFRKNLFKKASNTCNNCKQIFPDNYLAPDHRIPSIVVADMLSEENYMEKLQTLCVRCNQVKREACKKCPYDHKCEKCGWAYPEKFGISNDTQKALVERAERLGKSLDEYITQFLLGK